MDKKPLILITNDDGVFAPGIRALIEVARKYGEIYVVAPDKGQSGMGHAITINSTIRLNKIDNDEFVEYSCSGTPVDCVKLGGNKILPRKPDLILSGINHGSNSSISVIYSGTMSAAVEGAIEGIPSIGFSLCSYRYDVDYTAVKHYVAKLIEYVLQNSLPKGTCLNVNFPETQSEPIKGIKLCRQAKAIWIEEFDERMDPSGRPYYWLTGHLQNPDLAEDTDEFALKNNYVSVVPVQFDMTSYTAMNNLKNIEL